jgi:hypothetical protein
MAVRKFDDQGPHGPRRGPRGPSRKRRGELRPHDRRRPACRLLGVLSFLVGQAPGAASTAGLSWIVIAGVWARSSSTTTCGS